MAVIYCNQCTLGVHYIDLCRGGANGYPEKSKKQMRKEYTIYLSITFVALAVMYSFIFWLVSL